MINVNAMYCFAMLAHFDSLLSETHPAHSGCLFILPTL